MSGYLTQPELVEVRDAAIESGYGAAEMRQFLFAGILRSFESVLPRYAAPGLQVQSDLSQLNSVERLVDGSVPLEQWLRNATAQTLVAAPRAVFETAMDKVAASAAGEPEVSDGIAETELAEEIIFLDDMVPYSFLGAGARAGAAVARLTVPPYENGVPRGSDRGLPAAPPHAGTGWLITPTLLITNHHVVNARTRMNGTRTLAEPADLVLQVGATTVTFDYDDDGDDALSSLSGAALVAADAQLDYAVLRLPQDVQRGYLTVAAVPFVVEPTDRVAVNVIQHPAGGVKRVGLRNNLVHRCTDQDLSYFTDTRGGSSGSPVCTDEWVAVALHRGSQRVDNVRFQGKSTAFINVGTQVNAILSDLSQRAPEVHAEIRAAQGL